MQLNRAIFPQVVFNPSQYYMVSCLKPGRRVPIKDPSNGKPLESNITKNQCIYNEIFVFSTLITASGFHPEFNTHISVLPANFMEFIRLMFGLSFYKSNLTEDKFNERSPGQSKLIGNIKISTTGNI